MRMPQSPRSIAVSLWIWAAVLLCTGTARGAGMFVTPHGARPLARGGAFTAGADDLNAIYYNPAGVATIDFGNTGWTGLLDGAFVLQHVTFTRDENGIARPPVSADSGVMFGGPLIIPQFGFARTFKRSWGSMSFGLGFWIPYTGLPRYPEPDYGSPEDSAQVREEKLQQVPNVGPQRYGLIGLHDGSLSQSTILGVLNPVASFRLGKDGQHALGIGPQLMLVYFRTRIMLNGCPGVMCRPEQVDFDTLVLAQAFAVVPSFNLGYLYQPRPWLRVGAAFQFPFFVRSATGSVDTRLPQNEFFNGAQVTGRDASMSLNLPPILRVGAEFRPLRERLRVELGYTFEGWGVQKDVTFTPDNIAIENVKGIGTYKLGPIALPREMMNTHTLHLGLEWFAWKYLIGRLGGMFETSSMPDATITVLTPDNHKGMLSVGVAIPGLRFLRTEWRLDLSYGHIFQPDRTVLPQDSKIYPGNPIRPEAQMPEGVGGHGAGLYQVGYDIIALGFSAIR